MSLLLLLFLQSSSPGHAAATSHPEITIRTESYARGASSEVTYFIYESDGQAICVKLKACDKFGTCSTEYRAGAYLAEEDSNSNPYDQTGPVVIAAASLPKHECLRRQIK